MAVPSTLVAFTRTLSFRLFVILSLAILTLFTLHAAFVQHLQTLALENQAKATASGTGDLIRQSLYTSMLRNERDRIHEMITAFGREPGVERIRLYNKQGVITYSSAEQEIGSTVDLRAEACYVCHAAGRPLTAVPATERARVYRKPDSHRVLGLITPIPNDASCTTAACHAHPKSVSVLGVLDVQMSLTALDRAAADARRRGLLLAAAVVLLSMGLVAVILRRAVYRPIRQIRRGTDHLAEGDLSVTIDLPRTDELGLLAESFNRMARSLQDADAELRDWSKTLEDRVQQKTHELEQMNRQLVQVERSASLGRMAATVAHELNNPLAGILAYAKLTSRRINRLLPENADRKKVLDALELIQSESLRCGNIVRNLLVYARQGSAEFKPARLHELVGRALQVVAHQIELRHVTVTERLELEDDALQCDPEQIEQALLALLVNAVEAMGEGGHLTVRTWRDEAEAGAVRVSVGDTGVGMTPEVRSRIFDPFFSTKHETKGVGLGLAVVYGIVQRHDARIEVESEPGRGTTFIITLPRKQPATLAAGAGRGEGGAKKP